MLKIYNAFNNHGEVVIQDYIDFKSGRFNTGLNGFGMIKSGNPSCKRANYELQELKDYKKYLESIKQEDGYVIDYYIFNPVNYEMLKKIYKNVKKNEESYEKYGLNEEALLLFTKNVRVLNKDNLVKRIFGRYSENSLYLVMPNASFGVTTDTLKTTPDEKYEVLQSKKLGKQLVLAKMKRNI